MRPRAALLILTVIAAVPALRADEQQKSDLDRLQGKWKALVGPNKDIPIILEITNTSAVATFTNQQGEAIKLEGEIKLGEMGSVKTLDWVNFKNLQGDPAQPNLAIYKLEEDRFTVCNGGPGNPRPTEFREGESGPPHVLLFERVKDESKPSGGSPSA
jgi:uncharacterized protein (TIGR03067 family)